MERKTGRIAVISDTHGLLRPEVAEILKTCDAVVHGGDINSPEILEEIRRISPSLYVVREIMIRNGPGNCLKSFLFLFLAEAFIWSTIKNIFQKIWRKKIL